MVRVIHLVQVVYTKTNQQLFDGCFEWLIAGGEDAGGDHGRVRAVLAALLPHVRHTAVLRRRLLPARQDTRGDHLARVRYFVSNHL